MESIKIKEMNCDEDNSLTPSSVSIDTMCHFSPLMPHGIGKRRFMITDILNSNNKNTATPSRTSSPNTRNLLHPHATTFSGSAFQSLSTPINTINADDPPNSPTHLNIAHHHPAAAAAAMAAIGAAGSDLRLYSNFLPAAALQQLQQHREQLLLNHQRVTGNEDIDNTIGKNSNDVDIEDDTAGDSEG